MRLSADVRVASNAHHSGAGLRLGVQCLELVSDHVSEVRARGARQVQHHIIDLHRVGQADQGATDRAHREGLIIMIEIAVVADAGLGHEIRCALGVRAGG